MMTADGRLQLRLVLAEVFCAGADRVHEAMDAAGAAYRDERRYDCLTALLVAQATLTQLFAALDETRRIR